MATLPNPPSGGRPLRRFAIFMTFLLVLIIIGSQPKAVVSQSESVCVCMASKAALLVKSIKTMAGTKQASSQTHLTETASTAK